MEEDVSVHETQAPAADSRTSESKAERAALVKKLQSAEKTRATLDSAEDPEEANRYDEKIACLKEQISSLKPIGAQITTLEKSIAKLEDRRSTALSKVASYQHIADHTSGVIQKLEDRIMALRLQDQADAVTPPTVVIPTQVTMTLMASLVRAMETRDTSNMEALLAAAKLQVQYFQASTTEVPDQADADELQQPFVGDQSQQSNLGQATQEQATQAQHAAQEAQNIAAVAQREAQLAAQEAAAFEAQARAAMELQAQQQAVLAEAHKQAEQVKLAAQMLAAQAALDQAAQLKAEKDNANGKLPAPSTPQANVMGTAVSPAPPTPQGQPAQLGPIAPAASDPRQTRSRSHSPRGRSTARSMSPESILRRCQEEDQELLDNL